MATPITDRLRAVLCAGGLCAGVLAVAWLNAGCARLPYTTRVIQQDPRVTVTLQREIEPAKYGHPIALTAAQVNEILRGFTIRKQVSLPLRWFAEEEPPNQLFREDERLVLAPALAEAFRQAGPGERLYFELTAPGQNPRYDRDLTAGWLAIRGPLLHLTIEYFHVQTPATRFSPYDLYYPTPRAEARSYVLYFEPGRFWMLDRNTGQRGVEYEAFLKTGPVPRER